MFVGIISRPSSITCQICLCTPELWPLNCPKLGFPLSKSKSFGPVLIKLDMLVGIISWPSSITCQIPLGTPELWPLNCPKLGFPLSKSKTFGPVLIKLGEYVGGHNILTKFYNLPNPPRHSWIMTLELSKIRVSANVVITIEFTTNMTGIFCVSLALLLSVNVKTQVAVMCVFSFRFSFVDL